MAGQPCFFGGHDRVQHVHSLGAERVELPELRRGSTFLRHMPIREVPADGLWRTSSYQSDAPALFVVTDAVIHSSPGILAVGGYVASESLDHTEAHQHGYDRIGETIRLHPGEVERVDDVAISLLAGSCGSLYHWHADAVGRLGVPPSNFLRAATLLLIPAVVVPEQRRLLSRLPLPPGMAVRAVRDGETLCIRTLLVPSSVSAGFRYHPCLRSTLRAALGPGPTGCRGPRRIYIDRRNAPARRLVNEDELVAHLARVGVVPVVLEAMTLDDQISLLASADLIVAPHGAGLANCVFAPPGCRVVELLMDSYVNWCSRNLAGLCGLDYDCVIGRTLGPWAPLSPEVHGSRWEVSVGHVIAAIA